MSEESHVDPGRPCEVSIVGSTGSIGLQALDVVRAAPGQFRVVALAAHRSIAALAAQAAELHPEVVAVADKDAAVELAAQLPAGVELLAGEEALPVLAERGDVVLNAVVGFAGLPVTLAALASGRRLALANKESLIAGAPVVQAARAAGGGEILPVDSEHCAIHQCLGERRHVGRSWSGAGAPGAPRPASDVARLLVTASGGPFRGRGRAELAAVSVADALAHPTWNMGPKITIDSSTLMNKGLEVIEAHELFGVDFDRIEVVVHPQSIIHSMVEFCDGATIAQLSRPDMRLPIGYALSYPERLAAPFGALDWSQLRGLDFEQPDLETFPCLALAYAAGRAGNSVPATLNAANEVAVAAFLADRIGWLDIAAVVEETLAAEVAQPLVAVGDVLAVDAAARRRAEAGVARRQR
jgi:1-deoxy-D-xylulose-5-phosphate reductoisomerase